MNKLLITNNNSIIDKYQHHIDIINSILLGADIWDYYDYIIIDEQNIEIEEIELSQIIPIKNKVAILGYTPIDDFIFINKEEFNVYNIEYYFQEIEDNEDEPSSLEETINEIELEKIKYMGIILDKTNDLKKDINDLKNLDYSFREELYRCLPTVAKKRVIKESNISIKIDFIRTMLKVKFNKIILREKG
ncbi:hypothetical protein NE686_17130 [Tissierella carlieri]|uniref:Uncharacterized protein n=1 Tax=Tissierella carlieri TaxID=689904 RepID=A0ABT1SEC4_9FIRM|nr:hypothetical protein [Tissierella carlieri]MCQ4924828.1 hypothetical protein [Tissierella carlieri]